MTSSICFSKEFILLFIPFLIFGISLSAQETNFEPSILILTPNERISDKKTKLDINEANVALEKIPYPTEQEIQQALNEMQFEPKNFQIMFKTQLEFSKNLNFYSSISSFIQRYLSYRFYEKFENYLVYELDENSNGNLNELASLAENHNMRYVLNIKKVKSWEEKSTKKTSIQLQLYDSIKNSLVLDKEYTGDDTNPGFEFACSEGSINCTVNNSLSQGLKELIEIVVNNNATIIKERILAQERAEVLMDNYFSLEPNKQITSLIKKQDSSIITKGFYHGFFNPEMNKFISFFLVSNEDVDTFKKLTEKKQGNVQIIKENIYDLERMPTLYSYVIIGIKKNENWYLKEDKKTYFNASDIETGRKMFFNNLQNWNFFEESSVEQNSNFWNTYFFSQIERAVVTKKDRLDDLKKKKDLANTDEYKEMFQDMIDDIYEEDLKNVGYFGEYTLVASALKQQARDQNEIFKSEISKTLIQPFFEKYISSSKPQISNYIKLNTKSFAMIYPRERDVILIPIVLEYINGDKILEYFVLIHQQEKDYKFYKWNYFDPNTPELSSVYGSAINEQLNTLTTWNFSFDFLNDSNFWDNYVLSKKDGVYQYLKQIQ